jgi:hypothetical protein
VNLCFKSKVKIIFAQKVYKIFCDRKFETKIRAKESLFVCVQLIVFFNCFYLKFDCWENIWRNFEDEDEVFNDTDAADGRVGGHVLGSSPGRREEAEIGRWLAKNIWKTIDQASLFFNLLVLFPSFKLLLRLSIVNKRTELC